MEPYGLFSPFIPAAALSSQGHLYHLRERQGLVPDLLLTFPNNHGPQSTSIAELKLVSAGKTWYHGNKKAVDVRANKLPKEYQNKAKHIDQTYNHTNDNQVGPVQQKLESFGELSGLVVGQFGECSQDLHNLLRTLADIRVENLSRSQGFSFREEKSSLILQQYRRRLSFCAVRAQSACLLSRLGHMSEGASLAAQRRAHCMRADEAARQDLRSHFEAHVRGRQLHKSGLLHFF